MYAHNLVAALCPTHRQLAAIGGLELQSPVIIYEQGLETARTFVYVRSMFNPESLL